MNYNLFRLAFVENSFSNHPYNDSSKFTAWDIISSPLKPIQIIELESWNEHRINSLPTYSRLCTLVHKELKEDMFSLLCVADYRRDSALVKVEIKNFCSIKTHGTLAWGLSRYVYSYRVS